MDPFIIGASVASGVGQAWSNWQNLRESKRARQWMERMSGSAYQRAVADMRMAGLNPALAYSQGGASTPGGPTASVEDVIGPAVNTAQAARRLKTELDVMYKQGMLAQASEQKAWQERETERERTRDMKASADLKESALPEAKAVARLFEQAGAGGKAFQLLMPLISRFMGR